MTKRFAYAAIVAASVAVTIVEVHEPAYAQVPPASASKGQASEAEIDVILKKDPELSKGFKTPAGNTVKVERASGGVTLVVTGEANGTIHVTGPLIVMKKSTWERIADYATDLIKGGKMKCTTTTHTTFNSNGTIKSITTSTVCEIV